MNPKLKVLLGIAILFSAVTPSVSDITSADGVIVTSVIQLLTHPERYQDKRVQVIGFYVRQFEASGIFMTKEAAELEDLQSSIWLGFPDARGTNACIQSIRHGYVTVVGTFRFDPKLGSGHLGAWLSQIANITLFVQAKRKPIADDP